MAEVSEMTDQGDVGERLEHVEVELRSPSVVLSVRLDENTAKRLHAIARSRSVRMSEILREAAVSYVSSTPQDQETPYSVGYGTQRFTVGVAAAHSQGGRGSDTSRYPELVDTGTGWGSAVKTGLAVAG